MSSPFRAHGVTITIQFVKETSSRAGGAGVRGSRLIAAAKQALGILPKSRLFRVAPPPRRPARRSLRPQGHTLTIALVSTAKIRELNRRYRKRDRPTDVLSFSQRDGGSIAGGPIGDIVIGLTYAARQAREAEAPVAQELCELVIHGVLHLFGYDHARPADQRRMFRLQATALTSVCRRPHNPAYSRIA